MTHLTATAFGFDSADESSWRWSALCAGRWDEWSEFLRIDPDNTAAARAAHGCKQHCPVFAECLAYTQAHPPESGIVQAARHRPHRHLVEIDDSQVFCTCRPLASRDAQERKRAADRRRWHRQQAQRRELALAGAQ